MPAVLGHVRVGGRRSVQRGRNVREDLDNDLPSAVEGDQTEATRGDQAVFDRGAPSSFANAVSIFNMTVLLSSLSATSLRKNAHPVEKA
jgi:hypothetical protein